MQAEIAPLTSTSAKALTAIPRASLREVTLRRVRKAIESGELKAGQQITEIGLARQLNVAQATIREALLELEFAGFVERVGRKTRVTLLTRQKIDEIYVIRTRLEALAVELLVAMRKASHYEVEEAHRRMVECAQAGDATDFYEADLNFHRTLWRTTGNESLADILERLVPKLFAFVVIRQARPSRKKLLEIAKLHRQLLSFIAARETEAAKKVMELSMARAWMDDVELP